MQKSFEIRPADKHDVPVIFNFIKQLAEQGKLSSNLVATEEILEKYLFGSKVYAEVILGCVNQKPISYAMFSYHFSTLFGRPTLYLVDLFVQPEFRQQGIAQNLLIHLAKIAKEQNCCRIEWSVLEWNETAIELYKKIGSQELSDWRIYRISGDPLDALANQNVKEFVK